MKQATRDALKVHLSKLKAGDMAAPKDEAPAIYCALPIIFVSPHHLQPATLPIQIYLPSLQPLELLSDYPAPRHHSHHRPCQHPYPRKHLARFSPRPCADLPEELIDFARRFKHWRVRLGFTQTHTWYLSFLASPDALEVIVVTDWLTDLFSVSTDLTDVTLVSDDTYWSWQKLSTDGIYQLIKVIYW